MTNEDLTQVQMFKQKYEADIERLMNYVPYLTEKSNSAISHNYDGELGQNTMRFPVYDGALMSFIKEVQKSSLIDRNYVYAYTKRRIKTPAQEQAAIASATIADDDYLRGVISKYVIEGMRKTGLWQDAVSRRLFLNVILKFKELIDFNS